ncbi:flagellar motor switch protein FliG [Chelatococcus composti]|jgi:flagellar motor switch protein FliG|uniref:Flagellar motor switch protein FliG n=1 Tax=Chelatococcus composti TaxID=1743235 RepID=A0A841KCB7_9HYPH|nr:flagellar motor switch protein FliG [Chelatococcus composti]MBB6167646.1 flagellar motor switch protein FliG [Chelatococcus composti]MBS7735153.1 flagellar motor switch protein FliG [Chelatococcus composti]GGG37067.1 flagellar motor switch protein FliG [Chelatococcus composti]
MATTAIPSKAPQPIVPRATLTRGVEKVAALLLAMEKPTAGRLLTHFTSEEIKEITRTAAELGPIPASQIEALVEEFAAQFATGKNLFGTASEVEKLLQGVLPPEQIAEIMSGLLGNSNRSIWDRISNVSENVLASYLLKEHPQTAALILSKVKPACAAKTMSQLPQDLRNNIMRRMLTFKPIVDETMRIIERTIHEDFMLNFSRNAGADTHAKMADIINKMERDHMEDVLNSLSVTRPKSAEILKGLLFTFDDIVNLTPAARTLLFDQIPTDKIVLALKGTDPSFREVILSSLASRVRRMVEHELNGREPAAQRDVLEARRSITDLALELAGRGEIDLNPEGGDDAFIR